jgi:hypothetical protein
MLYSIRRAGFSSRTGFIDSQKLAELGMTTFNVVSETALAIRDLLINEDDDFEDLDEED